MRWTIGTADHIGGREEQQDRVASFSTANAAVCLLVVADGMGGHEGGALAAQAVVDTARESWESQNHPVDDAETLLREICLRAHERINALGKERRLAPRSTCVLLYAANGAAHWLSVGDSRLYHFQDGRLLERTRDQSVVQMMVDLGKITEAEMATHPDQNRLLHSVGGEDTPELQLGHARVTVGDSFLLCSDGLWETIEVAEMIQAASAPSLSGAAAQMVQTAAKRGGSKGDNIAVALSRSRGKKGHSSSLMIALSLAGLIAVLVGVWAWLVLGTLDEAPAEGGPPAADGAEKNGESWRDPDKTQ